MAYDKQKWYTNQNEQVRYPNQKRVKIEKVPINNGDYYLRIHRAALRRAAQVLDSGPFKLFIYLADNKDGYCLNLSQVAIERIFGMKKNQYYLAINKLKDAGYLYQPDPMVENYFFKEGGPDPIDEEEEAYSTEDSTTVPNEEIPNEEIPNEEIPKREISTFSISNTTIPPNTVEAKIAEDKANYPFKNEKGKIQFRW